MFVGTHFPRLDEKGRLFLPARFRDDLVNGFVMTTGQEGCLFGYAREQFFAMGESLNTGLTATEAERDFAREFFGSASDELPDKQGRVTIPAPLRDYAHLDRAVAVVGVGTRLEIWDAETWQRRRSAQAPAYSSARGGPASR